jgi:hypothetical protein
LALFSNATVKNEGEVFASPHADLLGVNLGFIQAHGQAVWTICIEQCGLALFALLALLSSPVRMKMNLGAARPTMRRFFNIN